MRFWPLAVLAVLAAACTGGDIPPGQPTPTVRPATPMANADPAARLLLAKGCGGCHTIPGVPGATGVTGPHLANIVLRPTLAGDSIPNSHDALVQWLLDPASLKPGTSMPKVGLTPSEATELADFLERQAHAET
jgi:cytochrome c